MLTTTQCPVCEGKTFAPYLTCIDYTVSHETFHLNRCTSCNLILTSPRPENNELDKYYLSEDYISHSNSSSTPLDKLYQLARKYSLSWKTDLVKRYSPSSNARLLDFGCGTGEFLNHAKKSGFKITGVEPSSIARTQAQILTSENISSSISEVHGEVNAITLWHVLEHIPNLNEITDQLKARLEKNGTMFIAVPNHQSHDAKIYQQHWAGYDVPRHLWHFSQTTMKKLLDKHALKLHEVLPMKLDAFYVSMLSEKYQRKKTSLAGLAKAFFNGVASNLKASNSTEYSSLIYVIKK